MKRIVSISILVLLIFGLFTASQGTAYVSAEGRLGEGMEDLIIQTDGSTLAIKRSIKALGGEVNYTYQNVPVLAVTIPVEKLTNVYQIPGVIRVAKDRLFYLGDDEVSNGNKRSVHSIVRDSSGFTVKSFETSTLESNSVHQGYSNYLPSGAGHIWDETAFGKGSLVAVVDSGTVPNVCLAHSIIGSPGFPDGYNATLDGFPATDPENHWHGTHVGGVLASYCILDFTGNTDNFLYQAIKKYFPSDDSTIPIFGQAPLAQIYPVKVFKKDGSGSPTSVIMKGLDHVLTLKREGILDVDVVNLSFGGPTYYDGRDILDAFLEEFREENILVVAAAGNGGPLPNSIASPATSFDSIAVGALDYPGSSRVYYEYEGLKSNLGPGTGMVMRPTDEIRVADMSSRGPMSDGRFGPDLAAPGMWSLQFGPKNLRWDAGTSFSAPVVAGTAALLNAYYEAEHDQDTPWEDLRNSLLLSANRDIVGLYWQDVNSVGYGALDAVAALDVLKSGETKIKYPFKTDKLKANILGNPMSNHRQEFNSGIVRLNPSESFDLVFDIAPSTNKVSIEVNEITTPDNSDKAFWPNILKVQLQSAKRTDFPFAFFRYWNPNTNGEAFTIEINDGIWTMDDDPINSQPMEPGLMKVSLIGDFANESGVTFNVRVVREDTSSREDEKPIAQSTINMGDAFDIKVDIPASISEATFDLVWNRDWGKFPTSDMNMLIYDPQGSLVSEDGATGNSPERAVIIDPAPGIWTVRVEAIEVYKTDLFRLYLNTKNPNSISSSNENINHQLPPFDIIAPHPIINPSSGTADDSASTFTIWLPIVP